MEVGRHAAPIERMPPWHRLTENGSRHQEGATVYEGALAGLAGRRGGYGQVLRQHGRPAER